MFSFGPMFSSDNFKVKLTSYSVAMIPGNLREDVDRGGKIIMPPSSLDWLTRMNASYPILFKLTNGKMNRITHCGVLEFIAEEGKVFLPNWMMKNMLLEEGDVLDVENTTLPIASFSKFQPQSVDFLDIHNPKAVLENSLRQYACLTTGDMINISYNDKNYELSVLETRPGDAVSIIECDMNVDFAPPLGYKDPSETGESDIEVASNVDQKSFGAFSGEGCRLDGKERKKTDSEIRFARKPSLRRGEPDFGWRVGTLDFMRKKSHKSLKESASDKDSGFEPFRGKGSTLRKAD